MAISILWCRWRWPPPNAVTTSWWRQEPIFRSGSLHAGLPYAQVGHCGSLSKEEIERARGWGEMRTFHFFTTMLAPPMIRDLMELCRRWDPDVIVHEETEYAAPLVGECLDVPCVTHSYAAPARPEDERAIMLSLLEPIWADHGHSPPRLWGETYLDACPPMFQTDAVGSIPGVWPIRPVAFDGPPVAPPAWLDTLERPAAYITFGTVALFARVNVIQQTVEAVAPTVKSVVVTTGPNPPEAFSVPSGVVVERYLRQSSILGSVDVVVSHGGAGTTLGAIEHGLAHVVLPQQTMSQLRNAERIEALGIGLHVPQGSNPDGIRTAVHRALEDPRYANRAVSIRDSLHTLPEPEAVLEDLHAQLE
jgi:hypothetical protein